MNWNGYLIFKRNKNYYGNTVTSRLAVNEPNLMAGEISIKLSAELPGALFERPTLTANIEIPKELVPQSIINTNIQNNIQQAVKEAVGVDIAFTIKEQREDLDDE